MDYDLPTAVPKVYADFNGMFQGGTMLCLSHSDSCRDESDHEVHLRAGMIVTAVDIDKDDHGVRDDLIATGVVQPSPDWLQCHGSRWVLIINEYGSDMSQIYDVTPNQGVAANRLPVGWCVLFKS